MLAALHPADSRLALEHLRDRDRRQAAGPQPDAGQVRALAQGAGGSAGSVAAGDRAACTGRDFARSVLRIRRQVQLLGGQLYFTLPKGGKTRVVDMPPSVAAALAQYFMEYPAVEVELPWGGPEPDRETKKFPLVITTTYGNALRANIFNVEVWKLPWPPPVSSLRKKGSGGRRLARTASTCSDTRTPQSSSKRASPSSPWPAGSGTRARPSPWTTTPTSCPRPGGKGRGAIDALLNHSAAVATAA